MKIGQSVKKVRKLKGVNQGEFSKTIGITQSYLSLIENDKRMPSMDLLEKMAKCFGMPLQFMLWFSITEDQIADSKLEFYRALKPAMDEIVNAIMEDGITLD